MTPTQEQALTDACNEWADRPCLNHTYTESLFLAGYALGAQERQAQDARIVMEVGYLPENPIALREKFANRIKSTRAYPNGASMSQQREALTAWSDDVALRGPDAPKNTGQIKFLIEYLLTVYERFGNTAITCDLQWGAAALWRGNKEKDDIDRLTAEVAGLKADAERWRFMREHDATVIRCEIEHSGYRSTETNGKWQHWFEFCGWTISTLPVGSEYALMDDAIDAARAALAAQEPTAQEQK